MQLACVVSSTIKIQRNKKRRSARNNILMQRYTVTGSTRDGWIVSVYFEFGDEININVHW